MAVAGRGNDSPAKPRQIVFDALPVWDENRRDKGLITFGVAAAGHRALQLHRADDIGEQKRLQLCHRCRYTTGGSFPAIWAERGGKHMRTKKARPAKPRQDGLKRVRSCKHLE